MPEQTEQMRSGKRIIAAEGCRLSVFFGVTFGPTLTSQNVLPVQVEQRQALIERLAALYVEVVRLFQQAEVEPRMSALALTQVWHDRLRINEAE